jgi:hypothetical protein
MCRDRQSHEVFSAASDLFVLPKNLERSDLHVFRPHVGMPSQRSLVGGGVEQVSQ